MVKLKIGDQEYGLRLDMYALEQIEEGFGDVDEMLEKVQKGSMKSMRMLFKYMANAQLSYEGKEETVTGEELKHLAINEIAIAGQAIRAAIEEGKKSETTGGEKADDDVYDVYLAEIEAKN